MKSLTERLYAGLVAAVTALTPSISYAHSAPEVDALGRITRQVCQEGDS